MQNNNEPKQDLQSTAEDLYDKLTATPEEQPQESSPETEQDEIQHEDGSDPAKTPSSVEESSDKGFASHPKWIERENKLKETREQLQAEKTRAEQFSKLLDDPEVYAKWLKSQGYSDAHIQDALREKGQALPQDNKSSVDSNQAQAIAQRVCSKLGWDINRLNESQKSYINDSVSLTMAIIQDTIGPMLDERIGPIEQVSNEWNVQKQFTQEELNVKTLASQEFPGHDFDQVIKPAIAKFLADLDEKDPKRTIKLSFEDIYYRATRPLLRELNESKSRQEVRDLNKRNLRPLGTGTATKTSEGVQRGKSARDEAEAFLDARGVR